MCPLPLLVQWGPGLRDNFAAATVKMKIMYAKCMCMYNKIKIFWGYFYVIQLRPTGVSSPRAVFRMASGRCPCVFQ